VGEGLVDLYGAGYGGFATDVLRGEAALRKS
jgi:hypothetical protein